MQLSTGIDEDVRRSRPPETTRPPGAAGPILPHRSEPSNGYPPSQVPVRAETDPDGVEPVEGVVNAQSGSGSGGGGGSGSGSGSGGRSGSAPSASIALTGDAYTDTATESRKDIKFNATWSGGAQADYVIVQWVKGSIKNDKGKPFKVSMYDKLVDSDFADWQIDSIDADPAYWSKGGVRWNYNVDAPNKFSATDSPGPVKSSWGSGAQAKLSFKTGVYKNADVPNKTTGSIVATPLSSLEPWEYNVTVDAAGKFTH